MNSTKATLDFSNYKAATLASIALVIYDRMSANAVTFPNPPTAMPALRGLIDAYRASLAAKPSRATADTTAYKVARRALESALGPLGGYVNMVAQGDPSTVLKSGFPSYGTSRPAVAAPPGAPDHVRLRHGVLRGSITVRCRPKRTRSANELQINEGNPENEAGWVNAGVFTGGRTTINGLPVGTVLWVRIRTAGLNGVMGAWSNPVEIVVI